jgi:hypothetical protein
VNKGDCCSASLEVIEKEFSHEGETDADSWKHGNASAVMRSEVHHGSEPDRGK